MPKADSDEARAEPSPRRVKFAELATKRVNRATQAIRVIGNLANKRNYEYTNQDATRIIQELHRAVLAVKKDFASGGTGSHQQFKIEP